MSYEMPGANTLAAEVTNIWPHGFWIVSGEREMFVPFAEFPWFREAPIAAICKVEQLNAGHLYWPNLDVDLTVDSIEHPERYPLVAR